jgi:cell division septal protein FtsQ
MEIRTNRSREVQSTRTVPPPDRGRRRRKAPQKLGNGHIAGRRFISFLRTLGKLGAFFLTAVFMLSVFVSVCTSDKFNLRNVRFHGCKELDPKQLEEIIRQEFPANTLRIDLHQLKSRLEKENWAKSVEIQRILPSDLVIFVQERTPSVILEMHNELMVADNDGRLLGRHDPRFGKLDVPVFRGVMGKDSEGYRLYQEENAARIRQALTMLSEIESGSPKATQKISEVDISDRNNLKIMLVDDTAEVNLGEKDYLKRFNNLMKYWGYYQGLKNQNRDIAAIILSFPGQIVYQGRGASAGLDSSVPIETQR